MRGGDNSQSKAAVSNHHEDTSSFILKFRTSCRLREGRTWWAIGIQSASSSLKRRNVCETAASLMHNKQCVQRGGHDINNRISSLGMGRSP